MIQRFEEFTKNIAIASKCIAKIKAYKMKRFGLKSGNVMCLFFLGKHSDGLTPTQLGSLCGEDKAGISRSLATLRAKGYAEVISDGCKKYRAKYRITDAGTKVCETINNAIIRAVDRAGGNLTCEERDSFYRSLNVIISNLMHYCDELGTEEA